MADFRGAGRLRELLEQAARGSYPAADWAIEVVPAPPRLVGAVVAFTGCHVIAADVEQTEAGDHLDTEDIAAASSPAFLAWVGERLGARVGRALVTLARMGIGAGDDWLRVTHEPPDNERVRRARSQRVGTVFLEPPEGGAVVTLGTGLADRREISMEIAGETNRNGGLGTRLVRAAVDHVSADEAIFASVAPGNARSIRCLLHAGFVPIGSECLFSAIRPSVDSQ